MSSDKSILLVLSLAITALALVVIVFRSVLKTRARRYKCKKAALSAREARPTLYCKNCGAPYKAGDINCPACNTLLYARGFITPEEAAARKNHSYIDEMKRKTCQSCGIRAENDDKYCNRCGKPL